MAGLEASDGAEEYATCLQEAGWGAAALGEFRRWYELRRDFGETAATVEMLLEAAQRTNPALTAEQLEAMGQEFFSQLAIKRLDGKEWSLARKNKVQETGESTLTPEERESKMREILGI